MTKEEINIIIKYKKIPLTFKLFLHHYLLAILMIFFWLFILIDAAWIIYTCEYTGPIHFGLTLFSITFLLPALAIFLYYGPRQLKLKCIDLQFPNDIAAFECALETIKYLNWDVISNNGSNYLRAIRYFNFTTPNSAKATQIIIIIDNKQIFLTSLYYPISQASWLYNRNDKNIKNFIEAVNKKQVEK